MRGGGRAARTLKKRDLGFDSGFFDQHDGQTVPNRIHAVALRALQTFGGLAVFQIHFAGWADQHFKKVFGEHGLWIIRQERTTQGLGIRCREPGTVWQPFNCLSPGAAPDFILRVRSTASLRE